MKVSVIGAGTWGTALAIVLAKNGHEVYLWTKFPEEAERLARTCRHPNLPGAFLPRTVEIGTELDAAMQGRELLVLAVPSIYVRETVRSLCPLFLAEGAAAPPIVSVVKGIEEGSLLTMSEVVEAMLPGAHVAVLSGPSHAEEVSRLMPTTIVSSARSRELALLVQDVFMNEQFRVYINADWKGIEIGAALKNVVALAAGIADGLHYGDNAKAAIITRGIAEITRLGVAMGCKASTFAGLSGIGDLIVTCVSVHSRNRQAGVCIGEGKSYEEAMREVGQVVEGVYAAKAARALSEKHGVDMPIVSQVNAVLFQGKDPREAVRELMNRDRRAEDWG